MSREFNILCGGYVPDAEFDPAASLRLNLWGGGEDENVQLRIEDLHQALYSEVPEQFSDLVEIAAYVYCADQAIKRTGQDTDSFGEDWRREFRFHVPVRCAGLWNRKEVKEALIEALSFLSDDVFSFAFYPTNCAPAFQTYLKFASDVVGGRPFERVVMFSGGLDSLSGAIEETLVNKSRIVLVTHESTPKNAALLRQLQDQLSEKAGPLRPLLLRVRANKAKRLGKEYTQRTRSFLFASFGVTVAMMMGLDTLRFYENGIVSVNLPVSAQVIGSRATRTTHPRTLIGFRKLFSLLNEKPIVVENPFIWTTKAEVIRKIIKASCGEMIGASTSCAHTWVRTNTFTHCGVCSQCIDRRLAMTAANADSYDPAGQYKTNIFVDSRPVDDDKMMLAAYLDRATAVGGAKTTSEFIAMFPQIADCLAYMTCGPTKAAELFFGLYRDHAREVAGALSAIVQRHASVLVDGTGGGGCLLHTLIDSRGADPSMATTPERSEVLERPTMRFRGADWLVILNGRDITVRDLIGMRYIAILFGAPGEEYRHGELYLEASPATDPLATEGVLQSGGTRGIPATDLKTLRAVEAKLAAIADEEAAARANGDTARLADLEEQQQALQQYLSVNRRKGGTPRLTNGRSESTRVSVLRAITVVKRQLQKSQRNCDFLNEVLAIRSGQAGHLVYSSAQSRTWEIFGP